MKQVRYDFYFFRCKVCKDLISMCPYTTKHNICDRQFLTRLQHNVFVTIMKAKKRCKQCCSFFSGVPLFAWLYGTYIRVMIGDMQEYNTCATNQQVHYHFIK